MTLLRELSSFDFIRMKREIAEVAASVAVAPTSGEAGIAEAAARPALGPAAVGQVVGAPFGVAEPPTPFVVDAVVVASAFGAPPIKVRLSIPVHLPDAEASVLAGPVRDAVGAIPGLAVEAAVPAGAPRRPPVVGPAVETILRGVGHGRVAAAATARPVPDRLAVAVGAVAGIPAPVRPVPPEDVQVPAVAPVGRPAAEEDDVADP